MKLYGHPISPCTRKILLLAREKGAALRFEAVDLLQGAQRAPGYDALHPFRRVPVLEDEDYRLYESRAILRYLDARWPGPAFTPRDLRERARMEQWLSVDHSYVAPHTRALALENVVRPSEGATPDAAVIDAARSELCRAFDVLEQALTHQPYLVGRELSLADLSLLPYLASLPLFGAEDLLTSRPRLFDYRRRLLQRPGYAELLSQ